MRVQDMGGCVSAIGACGRRLWVGMADGHIRVLGERTSLPSAASASAGTLPPSQSRNDILCECPLADRAFVPAEDDACQTLIQLLGTAGYI